MRVRWEGPLKKHPRLILDEAGYHEFFDKRTEQVSYILRLSRDFYPRFHIYLTDNGHDGGYLNLHIDQKQASYIGQTAHSGEYNGTLVKQEAERLKGWFDLYLA